MSGVNDRFDFFVYLTGGIAALLGSFAAAAGIGGGGLYVPLYIFIAGLKVSNAIPRSSCTMLGLGIGNFIFNSTKHHPKANRPQIDYDVILALQPCMMLGSAIGVLLNTVFPDWLLIGLLVIILSYSCVRSYRNTYKLYKKENAAIKADQRSRINFENDATDNGNLLEHDVKNYNDNDSEWERASLIEKDPRKLDAILKDESKLFPLSKYAFTAFIEIGIFAYSILRGPIGGTSVIGVTSCSPGFWGLTVGVFPYFMCLLFLVSFFLRRRYVQKVEAGYSFYEGDVHWTPKYLCIYPVIGFLAGFCSGLLGLSSGMIIGPILLELGLLPSVITATTAFMIILLQSSVMFQYLLFDRISIELGAFFFGVGMTASLLGQVVLWIKNKISKRDSLLAALMSTVVGVCCLLLLAAGLDRIINNQSDLGFHSVC